MAYNDKISNVYLKMLNENISEHPMIEVDGVMKHRHNSLGQPIHPTDEGIKNFHRWFGDSKAVDEHGRPKVFYHGSPSYGFKEFDINRAGQRDRGDFGEGIYFTPSKHYASSYETPGHLNSPGDGNKTYSVYLSIKSPLKHSARSGAPMPGDVHGKDGIIVYNDKFYELPFGHPKNMTEIVAFHPSQIKSATDNSGSFSHPTKITESIDPIRSVYRQMLIENTEHPIELQPHIDDITKSGRFYVTNIQKSSYSEGHTIHFNAKKSPTAVDFDRYTYRPNHRGQSSWYDPDISKLQKQNEGESFETQTPILKSESDYHQQIQAKETPGMIYRGMSNEEFNNIMKTGKIRSRGDYNMDGQEGLTYFSTDPSAASNYAHSFAPLHHKATGEHNAYVIGVKDPGTGVKIEGTGEHEVGIPHEIDVDQIREIHIGKAYASHSGDQELNKEWGQSKFTTGSSSFPVTHIAWKKVK